MRKQWLSKVKGNFEKKKKKREREKAIQPSGLCQ